MTSREARKVLANLQIYHDDNDSVEALSMGIESLKICAECVHFKERPHGEAIYKKLDEESGVANSYWCSHCGFPIVQVYMSFCGHCGAEIKSKVKQMETEEGESE